MAAIFFRGHPYIWRTTVRHDRESGGTSVYPHIFNLVLVTIFWIRNDLGFGFSKLRSEEIILVSFLVN